MRFGEKIQVTKKVGNLEIFKMARTDFLDFWLKGPFLSFATFFLQVWPLPAGKKYSLIEILKEGYKTLRIDWQAVFVRQTV